jgi:hypothetical protein
MRQRQRQREGRQAAPAAPELRAPDAVGDAPGNGEAAAADAAGVLRISIRTTASAAGAVSVAATADTPIGEVLDRACGDLGLGDPGRWTLVARGEVIGDRDRALGTLAREGQDEEIAMRLVRRPEAGWRS